MKTHTTQATSRRVDIGVGEQYAEPTSSWFNVLHTEGHFWDPVMNSGQGQRRGAFLAAGVEWGTPQMGRGC